MAKHCRRFKILQGSSSKFFSLEDWLFFLINMASSWVTMFFPPQIEKGCGTWRMINSVRWSHLLSIYRTVEKTLRAELKYGISTKHASLKVECDMVSSTEGNESSAQFWVGIEAQNQILYIWYKEVETDARLVHQAHQLGVTFTPFTISDNFQTSNNLFEI